LSFYLHRTPIVADLFFPKLLWRKPDGDKIYLTFDDGPDPKSTPIILSILRESNVKAIFFCLGENAAKYPDLLKRIIEEGHLVGNHSQSHVSGWRQDTDAYMKSVRQCQEIMGAIAGSSPTLFRPPYGRMKPGQIKSTLNDYEIVMWSLMSGDFDPRLSAEKCLHFVKEKTRRGDIVLFHDQASTIRKLEKVLPQYLEYCRTGGLEFSLI
jgi:peptidoglycan/xylan/chitin deacetylase (PgdA/CDA1 family)